MRVSCGVALLIGLLALAGESVAQQANPSPCPPRPTPPTRDAHTAGYVAAKELPDGSNAPANMDGNFIIGPTHAPAPEMAVQPGVPQGTVYTFDMQDRKSVV